VDGAVCVAGEDHVGGRPERDARQQDARVGLERRAGAGGEVDDVEGTVGLGSGREGAVLGEAAAGASGSAPSQATGTFLLPRFPASRSSSRAYCDPSELPLMTNTKLSAESMLSSMSCAQVRGGRDVIRQAGPSRRSRQPSFTAVPLAATMSMLLPTVS
jgi:hypothetical protein